MMSLGETIYNLRTGKNMSQGDLADALDVSRQSISKWETNSSVPELDKLIKLSEIFGVTLDELVMNKERPQAPDAQSTPAVEKGPGEKPAVGSTQKIVGTILLCFGAVVCLLLTVLGGFLAGLLYSLPFFACGVICLVARKYPGLWCAWAVYAVVDLYLRYATGINWKFALWSRFYTPEWTVQLTVAWALLAALAVLMAATVLCFRKKPLAATKKTVGMLIACCAVFLVTYIPLPAVQTVGMIRLMNLLFAVKGWLQVVLLALILTTAVRLIATRHKGK